MLFPALSNELAVEAVCFAKGTRVSDAPLMATSQPSAKAHS